MKKNVLLQLTLMFFIPLLFIMGINQTAFAVTYSKLTGGTANDYPYTATAPLAFDSNTGTSWTYPYLQLDNPPIPELRYQLSQAKIVQKYKVSSAQNGLYWYLYGSNNGTTWTNLHSSSTRNQEISISNTTPYLYYKLSSPGIVVGYATIVIPYYPFPTIEVPVYQVTISELELYAPNPPDQPAPPSGPSTDADGYYTISWGAVTDATSYTLQEKLNSGSWSQIYTGSSASYARTGRSPGYWNYCLAACNTYGCSSYSSTKTVLVPAPPTITNIPATSVNEKTNYNFTPSVSDPDPGDTFTYSITNKPSWATFLPSTGQLYGTPGNSHVGTYSGIVITVTDSYGLTTSVPSFSITVINVNDQPEIYDIPNQTINEGSSFAAINLDDYVNDVDNTDAQISWTYSGNNALGVSITNRVATITIPNADWYGSETITFICTDPGSLSSSNPATFTVNNINDAPMVSDIPNQTINEGGSFATINLDSYVSDVDNTDAQISWTYSGNNALGVSITNRVATITIPNVNWNGSETITFTASDGSLSAGYAAVFTVHHVNVAPLVYDIPNQTINEGSSFAAINLDEYVNDVDNTDAQISWTYSGNNALGVSITNRVATITIPNVNWYGSETITFTASDGSLSNSNPATFTVNNVNDAPTISGNPATSAIIGNAYSFTPSANDVDVGDTLTFSIMNKPVWASFNTSSGKLSGTPDSSYIGSYNNIIITVKDSQNASASMSFNITVKYPDSDNDNIPDYWEIQYGLNPNNANDANGDLDNDGVSNYLEYVFHTNPTNPNDKPADTSKGSTYEYDELGRILSIKRAK